MKGRLENNDLSGKARPDASRSSSEDVLRLEELAEEQPRTSNHTPSNSHQPNPRQPNPSQPNPSQSKPRLSKRRVAAFSGLGLVVVCLLAIGGLFYTLLNHSVSNEQVRAQIESQLTSVLGNNHSAIIGDTKVALGSGGLLSIDASDVKILQDGSTSLGVARELGVKVEPVSLITGDVVAQSVTMRGASIAIDALLRQQEDENLRPVWPRSLNFEAALRGLGQAIAELAGQVENAGLESINLEDAKLVGFDQLGLRSRTATIEELSIVNASRAGSEGELDVELRLKTRFSTWLLNGSWSRLEGGGRRLELQTSGMNLQDLIADSGDQNSSSNFTNDLAVAVSADFDAQGYPLPALFKLTVGDGSFPVDDKGLQARLLDAQINFNVDPVSNQINVSTSTLNFDGSNATFTGALRYPSSPEDSISLQPAFLLEVSDFRAFGLVDEATAPSGMLRTEGFLDPVRQTIVADHVVVKTPNGELVGNASIRMDGPSPHVKTAFAVESIPIDEFKQFWPIALAPKARDWVGKNIAGGQLKDSWVKMNFPSGVFGQDKLYTKDNLAARINLEATEVKNPGELPPIKNASGYVDIIGNHTDVTITDGTAVVADAGTLQVGKSTMKMGSYAIPLTPARLDLNFTGPASAMIKLASLDPIGFSNRLDIKPGEIKGNAVADVEAHFLIGQSLRIDEKPWAVRLKGKNISSRKKVNGRRLTNANMTIVASPKEAEITGTARLDNVPVKLALLENLDGSGPSSSKVVMTLSDKDRAKIGLDTGTLITGPVDASITDLPDGTRRIVADLKPTTLNFPWISWTKGKGIPATATFVMRERRGVTSFEKFKLKGQGFSARGSFSIDKNGLLKAVMKDIVLNQVDDFDVTVSRVGKGFDIALNARAYDGRAMIRSLLSAEIKPSQSTAASIEVNGNIKSLIGFGQQSLNDVKIEFSQKGKQISRVVINAKAPGNASTRFAMGPAPGGTQMEIATNNAGSVLRFLDLYSKIRGGSINANLNRDNSQVFRGRVVAENFDMLNEPRLAQLLKKPEAPPDIGDSGEVTQTIKRINPDKARVDHLVATIEKGPGFLNISRGRLWGGDAGAAFDGVVYDKNNQMNVTGTFLPSRGLNRLASKIPILGLALGRGKVHGLVGITFQLVGRFDNPGLRVNPLSLIAPGVFRQIFRF